MSSFSDTYDQWKALETAARESGSGEARQQAEQARIAVSHHPQVHLARSIHDAHHRNGPRTGGRINDG